MITVIVCCLLYVLGVLVSYVSTVLYFYYTSDDYHHYCRPLRIEAAKYDMGSYCMDVFCFTSWLYFIVLTVYVLSKTLKYVADKLIDYIIT